MRIARLGLALVKGFRHRPLTEIELTAQGPLGDRELCLIDPDSCRVLRTVEHPELMRLQAWRSDGDLVIDGPDRTVRDRPRPTGVRRICDYWGRDTELEVLESAHTAQLSEFVGNPVMLARTVRTGDIVYGDAVTLVTGGDIAELAGRVGDPRVAEEPARFRATAVVDDDGLLRGDCTGIRLRLGDATVEITGLIPRCTVIDHDPSSGVRDRALLKALGEYRRAAGGIWFGHYARVVSAGVCRAGDPVAEATA